MVNLTTYRWVNSAMSRWWMRRQSTSSRMYEMVLYSSNSTNERQAKKTKATRKNRKTKTGNQSNRAAGPSFRRFGEEGTRCADIPVIPAGTSGRRTQRTRHWGRDPRPLNKALIVSMDGGSRRHHCWARWSNSVRGHSSRDGPVITATI